MNNEIQSIWKDLYNELFAFINSKVKNDEVSKDILQDTFLKAHSNIQNLKDSSKLTSWIYQITRNNINDYFRKKKYTIQIEHLELVVEQEPSYQNLSNCINSKIKQLPEKYEEAMVLTTFKNLKQTELAEYLGISYSGTKSRVQRAKEKLKELVIACENVETDQKNTKIEHNLDD
ncbi:MAG: sigma-70 family RNA polymerase sigma factor [Chitinophagales bacterium]